MSRKKRALAWLLVSSMILGGTGTSTYLMASETMPFTDVASTAWYYNVIAYAYEKGLMSGMSETLFEPNTQITRSMVATVLYRLDGTPALSTNNTIIDVAPNAWYATAMNWAALNNILTVYDDDKIGPSYSITREELATSIYNYMKYKKYNVSQRNDLSRYEDINELNDNAKEAMSWANAIGLIRGISNTRLDPKGNTTRSQFATILKRFCQDTLKLDIKS